MKLILRFLACMILSSLSANTYSNDCPDPGCWRPQLNFDIEELGFMNSMIFISGQSYALSAIQNILTNRKDPVFCGLEDVSSRELIEILNASLSGVVTSEQVTNEIMEGLKANYPCKE